MRNLKICNLKFAICNAKKGLTLIELMIALFITSIAMGAVYTTFIVQQRSFGIQDQVSETQVSSNIASNIMVNDLRVAGFGYPTTENPSINGFTDIIAFPLSDNTGPNNADQITLVGGFRQVAILLNPTVVGQTSISISYLLGATSLNLTNRSNLTIDGIGFAIIDPANNGGCTLSGLDCLDSSPIFLDRGVSKPFPAGRPVYLVEDITYQIVTATGANCGNAPAGTTCLEKSVAGGGAGNVDTVANNIEDLQFAYAVDTDSDGHIEDQNGNSILDPGDYLSALLPNSRILAIRMNLLASTAIEDQTLDPNTKPYSANGITLENNTTIVTNDKFRRRIWSMEIALRNAR